MVEVDTSSTPHSSASTHRTVSGTSSAAPGGAGEDIIIGVIDSGHLAGEPELLDRTGRERERDPRTAKLAYQQIPGWHGKCTPGEAFNCVALQPEADRRTALQRGLGRRRRHRARACRGSSRRPRDYNGHGTHTASTAGGNHGVAVTTARRRCSAAISGMAPRARIAVYKALWSTAGRGDRAAATRSDLVAAIDQAVADGVDVINYSISGTTDELRRPGRDRVPVRGGRRCLRRGFGGQQRPGDVHGCAPEPVAHDGRGGYAQPQRPAAG